ncbi:reverse transcriptase domain-containing protein [Tanacetum coccineum]
MEEIGMEEIGMEEIEIEEIEMEEIGIEEMEMKEMEMEEMEIDGMEMVMEEEMAITSEDLCLLENAIHIANNLMDQKLKGYARSAKNKRRLDNNPRDNRGQQLVFKRQNVRGQNVARAYTAGNNEKKGDCKVTVTPNTQRAPVGNQPGIVCYECGRPRHFRKDCPKLRNQNCGNQTGKKNGNKTGNQTGGNEATARAYL